MGNHLLDFFFGPVPAMQWSPEVALDYGCLLCQPSEDRSVFCYSKRLHVTALSLIGLGCAIWN